MPSIAEIQDKIKENLPALPSLPPMPDVSQYLPEVPSMPDIPLPEPLDKVRVSVSSYDNQFVSPLI